MSSNESVSYISNDENSNMYGDENIQLPYNNSNENSSSNDYITIFKSYPNYIFNYGYKIFINDIKDIKNFMKRIVEIPSSMRIDEIQHKIEEIDVRNFPYLFVFDFKDVNSSEESRIIDILNKFLNNDLNFYDLVDKILTSPDSLMIRFLYLFKLDDEENDYLILKTAEKGNGQQLLAAIDLKFNYESNILDPNIEHILLNTCDNSSILKSAIDGKNSEIVKFLVEKFGFIIEKLDFDHKKIIIDQTENQEILILLITKVDFPFPTNRQNTNDEIQQLMKSKDEFHKAIKNIKESVCVAIHDLSAFLVQQISVY